MSVEALSWAFKQNISSSGEKLVLIALANRADEQGFCYPGYKMLAAQCSMTKRSVIRHVKSLSEKGFLFKHGRTRGNGTDTSNLYEIPLKDRVTNLHPRVTNLHPEGDSVSPHIYEQDIQREREGLTPNDFLGLVLNWSKSDEFKESEFSHISEKSITTQAEICFGRWENTQLKRGDPISSFKSWLQKGMKIGTVAMPSKETKTQPAPQKEPDNPEQPFHKIVRDMCSSEGEYLAFAREVWMDDKGDLNVPLGHMTDSIKQRSFWIPLCRELGYEPSVKHKEYGGEIA